MKKIIYSLSLLVLTFTLLSFLPAKTRLVSGDASFLKKNVSIYVEFDLSKSTIDALDTEEAFIEYHTSKKKTEADAKKWENGWKNDKEKFAQGYVAMLNRKAKKAPASFNVDDPNSDYKMIIQAKKVESGTPMKSSHFESKLIFIETATGEEKAVVYVPRTYGLKQGPTSPTRGMRVGYAISQSSIVFWKYYKTLLK